MDIMEKLVELIEQSGACFECFPVGDYEQKQIEKIANHLIAHGVTVQEWISVDDRLPDWRDGKVLVFTKYGFSICERTVNNRWQGQHANWITHWCRLPKPPKGE